MTFTGRTVRGFGLAAFFCVCAAQSFAATVTAVSASYDDVYAAITAANTGDTVVVPAGTVTWNRTLTISKRIVLQGAGVGITIIVGNVGAGEYIIRYSPTDALSTSYFRLTGFTIDANNNSRLLNITRETTEAPTFVRIDHNHFIAATSFIPAWEVGGLIYGVVDNNVFDGAHHIDNYGVPSGGGRTSWLTTTYVPGTGDSLYYEDNTFNICFTADTGGHGGRYVKRYNTYNLQKPAACYGGFSGFYPLFDAHGNQPSAVFATMGIEIYGNKINSLYSITPFLDQRGGKAMVLFNKITSPYTVTTRVRDEYSDSISLPSTALDGTPQRPNNSYYWNNRQGPQGATLLNVIETQDVDGALEENDEFLNYNAQFDGSRGIGCGGLASRPVSCNTGAAYWASSQSCSNLDDSHLGRNPAVPISGTLYRCIAPNTWVPVFTPYTYPHPGRAPAAPTGLTILRR